MGTGAPESKISLEEVITETNILQKLSHKNYLTENYVSHNGAAPELSSTMSNVQGARYHGSHGSQYHHIITGSSSYDQRMIIIPVLSEDYHPPCRVPNRPYPGIQLQFPDSGCNISRCRSSGSTPGWIRIVIIYCK